MDKANFTNLFEPFDARATRRYQHLRQAARTCFAALAIPTARFEDWRFTNVAPIMQTPFVLPSVARMSAPRGPSEGLRFLVRNGQFAPHWCRVPNGAHIGSLASANTDLPALGQIADESGNVFTALNSSLLADGALVVIPDGMVLDQPIEITFNAVAGDRAAICNSRTLIVVGKNAHVTVVERYVGDGSYFTNAVTEIALSEGAVLDHVKLQQESTAAYHIANTQIAMAAKSVFTSHYVSLGGALVRNEVRVSFDGEYAEATVNGLYMAQGKQHIDNFTVIDHAQPNCASHELYKGILDGQAHGVFNGKIFVRKDAQKTDAKQTKKVLLLSDDATINTKPQLEIFADDVKCTHGATIGQLDAAQLFYLQSRGIGLEQARRLLTFAFANDIVNRIKIEAVRDELESRIVR